MFLRTLSALVGLGAAANPLHAQRIAMGGPPPAAFRYTVQTRDTAPAIVHNWQLPALAGGGIVGTLGNIAGYVGCGLSESSDVDSNKCIVPGETGFLVGALLGGAIGGVIGSTATPDTSHQDHRERHGLEGALWLGIPSLGVNALAMHDYCASAGYEHGGCTTSNFFEAAVVTALNALLGYLIGKTER